MDAATQVFTQTTLSTDDATYRLIHLPASAIWAGAGVLAEIATPFSALVADRYEVTLLLPEGVWPDFAARLPDRREGGEYRLITFDQPLDPTLSGFMAIVTRVLAEAQIPILALSAFERDHVLVPAEQFRAAWDALLAAQRQLAAS